jgi:hypothetical protein
MNIEEIKVNILDLIESLYKYQYNLNKPAYRICLAGVELLNYDYFKVTGTYYIDKHVILEYHRRQWEIKWIRS